MERRILPVAYLDLLLPESGRKLSARAEVHLLSSLPLLNMLLTMPTRIDRQSDLSPQC